MVDWLRDWGLHRWFGGTRRRREEDARAVARRPDEHPEIPTALQKHVEFFDRDGDGEISLLDTYRGSRALGYGRVLSGLLAVSINTALGWPTADPPRPTLRIRIANIHRGRHGSDTDIYDELGRFVPEELDETFARYDKDGDGALDLRELWARARGDRDIYDLVGQIASLAEFGLVYLIAAEDGKLDRDTFRSIYDGSLFYRVEARVAEDRRRRAQETWLCKLLRLRPDFLR